MLVSIHDTRINRGGPAISPATSFRLLVPWRLVSGGFTYTLLHGRSGGAFFHVVGPLWDRLGSRVADTFTRVPGPLFSRPRKRLIILACG